MCPACFEGAFSLIEAGTGKTALAEAEQRLPDLVLTDIMMPEMDGFALLAALRQNPATRSIPVIMLSARAGEEARIDGVDAGADDYLTKPFSARELASPRRRPTKAGQVAQRGRRTAGCAQP